MLGVRLEHDDAGDWTLTVPEADSVDAAGRLQSVDVLSDEALVEARSRLNPAAGAMLSALWVASTGQLVLTIHHLAVDGVSWRILLEDFNVAWAQHRGGQPVALSAEGTSFARWASLLAEYAHRPEVVDQADVWRQVATVPAALPAVRPAVDTFATAGHLSVSLDVETTRMLLGEVPAAFHTGVHDILLIAFGLALAEFLEAGRRADRHRCRGPRAAGGVGRRCGLVAHGGVVHHQIPGVVGRRGTVLGAGGGRRGRTGRGDQRRQGAAARPPGRLDLWCAALPEPRCRPGRARPADRVQLSGAPRCCSHRALRRVLAGVPRRLGGCRCHAGHTPATATYRGPQCQHRRHRQRSAPER